MEGVMQMDAASVLAHVKKYSEPAVSAGTLFKNDRIGIRSGSSVWITKQGADLSSLKKGDLEIESGDSSSTAEIFGSLCAFIFKKLPSRNAVILSHAPYAWAVSCTGETVRPYVDDIAQIIGVNIKGSDPVKASRIAGLLKKRNAVFLKGSGVLCSDTSLDDAVASVMITEKACRIHVQSGYIGGAKPINYIESALMRFVYLKKYSKQAAVEKHPADS